MLASRYGSACLASTVSRTAILSRCGCEGEHLPSRWCGVLALANLSYVRRQSASSPASCCTPFAQLRAGPHAASQCGLDPCMHAVKRQVCSMRLTLATTCGEGVPSRSVISSSWCTTFLPGKRGFPSRISAKMQPMLQMSMAGEYLAKKEPHSSGARYQRVAT